MDYSYTFVFLLEKFDGIFHAWHLEMIDDFITIYIFQKFA